MHHRHLRVRLYYWFSFSPDDDIVDDKSEEIEAENKENRLLSDEELLFVEDQVKV